MYDTEKSYVEALKILVTVSQDPIGQRAFFFTNL